MSCVVRTPKKEGCDPLHLSLITCYWSTEHTIKLRIRFRARTRQEKGTRRLRSGSWGGTGGLTRATWFYYFPSNPAQTPGGKVGRWEGGKGEGGPGSQPSSMTTTIPSQRSAIKCNMLALYIFTSKALLFVDLGGTFLHRVRA